VEPSSAPWRVVESEPEAQPPPPGEGRRDLPWIIAGALLIVAVVAVSVFLVAARPDPGVEVDGGVGVDAGASADGLPDATGATADQVLVVEVGGAVGRPGVYRLAAGARVMDAVEAAGGFGPRVDAALADARLNLAAPVHDGDEIHVPVRGEGGSASPAAGGGGSSGGTGGATGPIDLNHASAEALDTLPGVGPATAAKIIAAREERPFASIDDVATRKVVGPATLEKIRPLVVVLP
jgi:competence protein ComEA